MVQKSHGGAKFGVSLWQRQYYQSILFALEEMTEFTTTAMFKLGSPTDLSSSLIAGDSCNLTETVMTKALFP